MQQKLFQFFLPQEDGAFGNNTEKKPQKPRLKKLKKYVCYIFTENLLFALPGGQCNWYFFALIL